MLFFYLLIVHIAVPVSGVLYLILGGKGVREIADDTRFLERLAVYGDKSHADGFKALVDVYAESHALYVRSLDLQRGDVFLHFGEVCFVVEVVDIPAEVGEPLRLYPLIRETRAHRLHTLYVVAELVKAMEQMPQTEFLLRVFVHSSEVAYELHFIKELGHLLSEFGEGEYVCKNLLSVRGNARVGGHLRDDIHYHLLLLGVVCQ